MSFYKSQKSISDNWKIILSSNSIWQLLIKTEHHRFYSNHNQVKAALALIEMSPFWKAKFKQSIKISRKVKKSFSNNLLKSVLKKVHRKHSKLKMKNLMKLQKKERKKSCFSKMKSLKLIIKITRISAAIAVRASPNLKLTTLKKILKKGKDNKIWGWEKNYSFSTLIFLTLVQPIKD